MAEWAGLFNPRPGTDESSACSVWYLALTPKDPKK